MSVAKTPCIAALRVCDYPRVVATLDGFTKAFKPKTQALKTLIANHGRSAEVESLLQDMQKASMEFDLKQVGERAHRLPLGLHMKRSVRNRLKLELVLEREINQAEKLFVESLKYSGLQKQFEIFKQDLLQRKENNRREIFDLVVASAQKELSEIKTVLEKMHIIEAEMLTHTSIADRLLKSATSIEPQELTAKNSWFEEHRIKFIKNQELWFDELGHYRVKVAKGCSVQSNQK